MDTSDTQNNLAKQIALQLGERLISIEKTCAVAESCTGGMIGAALTAIPGSSRWFHGGIIAYDNKVKQQILGVSKTTLEAEGAVSSRTVEAMAAGAAKLIESEYAVAVSGIAGPGGGTDDKPVGLVYIGVYYRGETVSFRHLFEGPREAVRNATVRAALEHLSAYVA